MLPDTDDVDFSQTGVQNGLSGLILAWANELNSDDSESQCFGVYAALFQC